MTTNEILEQLDKDTIIEIMEELGSPCYGTGTTSDGAEYLMFRTICHNGDSHKLWWYENTKRFQCWTCCGGMSVFDLISKVQHYSFIESLYYVANKLGFDTNEDRNIIGNAVSKEVRMELAEMDRLKESINRNYTCSSIQKFYDPQILNYFDPTTFYKGWREEGIEIETMKKYNIRFYYLEGHIIIPHYDIDGNLVGIRRRSLNPDDSKNKYMPEFIEGKEYGHPLGLNFYGIDKNKDAIKRQGRVVLVEGEKSVLQSDSFYGDKSITLATCGFNVSEWQIKTLKKLGVHTVYLGFDKDYDIMKKKEYEEDPHIWQQFLHYKKRLKTLAQRLSPDFTTYVILDRNTPSLLEIKDSPTDKGKTTFEQLLQSAQLESKLKW